MLSPLKLERMKQGITQHELANKLGVRDAWICEIETGRMEPSIGLKNRIAEALKVSVEILFPEEK